jgi:serine/threonine protein kinase
LGSGGFGQVFQVKHKILGMERAVKVIPKKKITNYERFAMEIGTMKMMV